MALIIFGLVVGGLILIVTFGFSNKLLNDLNDEIQGEDDYDNFTKDTMQNITDRNVAMFESAFLFVIGALFLGSIISGFTVERTPVFLVITILLLFVAGFLGMKMANFYEEFSSDSSDLIDFETVYPRANYVMTNLPMFVIGFIFVFALGVILRNRTGFI